MTKITTVNFLVDNNCQVVWALPILHTSNNNKDGKLAILDLTPILCKEQFMKFAEFKTIIQQQPLILQQQIYCRDKHINIIYIYIYIYPELSSQDKVHSFITLSSTVLT